MEIHEISRFFATVVPVGVPVASSSKLAVPMDALKSPPMMGLASAGNFLIILSSSAKVALYSLFL